VQNYINNVFFYTPAISKAQQQGNLVNASTLFNQLVQAIRSTDCQAVALPFLCQNLFTPCLNITNAIAGDTTTFDLVVRQPICLEHCVPLETICQEILTSSLIMSQIAQYPDAVRFMNCSSFDVNINNVITFPPAPGWIGQFNGGGSVQCAYLLENATTNETFVFFNNTIVWPSPPPNTLVTLAPPPTPTTPSRVYITNAAPALAPPLYLLGSLLVPLVPSALVALLAP